MSNYDHLKCDPQNILPNHLSLLFCIFQLAPVVRPIFSTDKLLVTLRIRSLTSVIIHYRDVNILVGSILEIESRFIEDNCDFCCNIKLMISEENYTGEVLRIVLIGLPYSGIREVAKLLHQDYGCQIFEAKVENKPESQSLKKFIRETCFQRFRETPRAVLLTSIFHQDIFFELKKRNYLNVVLVDASFKRRYQNFLKETGGKDGEEAIREFMQLDQTAHNEQFEKCLEFVRVRLMNLGDEKLKLELQHKQQDVLRFFRPTWDQYFMKMADIARRRSNCMKTSVGAVIVNEDNRVVSTGYNGTPKGVPSCYRMGCDRCNNNQGKQLDQCLCLHAEESAIIEVGIGKTFGCRLYTTYYPCFSCAKIICQAGIKKIYYMDQYEKEDSGKPFIQEYFQPKDVVKISADNLYY